MKILHIATGFKLSFFGGITNYVRALAKSQVEMGYEVHVLARPEPISDLPPGVHLKEYVPSKVAPFSLAMPEHDGVVASVQSLIQSENYDLVHFHMALDFPTDFLRAFPAFGVPYVVSLHDYYYICPRIFMVDSENEVCRQVNLEKCRTCVGSLDQIDLLRRAARKLKFPLPRVASRAVARRMEAMKSFLSQAELLLPVSTRTQAIYRDVVPDGRFQVEQIGNESAVVAPVTRSKSDKIRFTALGTLSKMKGAGVLHNLIKRVHRTDIEFHFYGRVQDGYDEVLNQVGLKCHGSYTTDQLPSILSETDIGLVLPIWEDNGPQVAMELVNNYIPVLGTNRGGVPDIVSEESGFLFDPDDPADVQRAVDWIEGLSKEGIGNITSRMRRLKTPAEHAQALATLYADSVRSSARATEVAIP